MIEWEYFLDRTTSLSEDREVKNLNGSILSAKIDRLKGLTVDNSEHIANVKC